MRNTPLKGLLKKSPIQHGTNPKGEPMHAKVSTKDEPTQFTDTDHEEYHNINPTEDLNEAEMKRASKKKNTIKVKKKEDNK